MELCKSKLQAVKKQKTQRFFEIIPSLNKFDIGNHELQKASVTSFN